MPSILALNPNFISLHTNLCYSSLKVSWVVHSTYSMVLTQKDCLWVAILLPNLSATLAILCTLEGLFIVLCNWVQKGKFVFVHMLNGSRIGKCRNLKGSRSKSKKYWCVNLKGRKWRQSQLRINSPISTAKKQINLVTEDKITRNTEWNELLKSCWCQIW